MDTKKVTGISKETRIDLSKVLLELAKLTNAEAENESAEIKQVLAEYQGEVHKMLERTMWEP